MNSNSILDEAWIFNNWYTHGIYKIVASETTELEVIETTPHTQPDSPRFTLLVYTIYGGQRANCRRYGHDDWAMTKPQAIATVKALLEKRLHAVSRLLDRLENYQIRIKE